MYQLYHTIYSTTYRQLQCTKWSATKAKTSALKAAEQMHIAGLEARLRFSTSSPYYAAAQTVLPRAMPYLHQQHFLYSRSVTIYNCDVITVNAREASFLISVAAAAAAVQLVGHQLVMKLAAANAIGTLLSMPNLLIQCHT
eukprot:2391-Heterococcus_DN1.PRE.4